MTVRTVDRAIRLFEAFADRGEPLTLSELARLLDMPTSTCFGIMRTLQELGYLYEVGGRRSFYPTARWLAKARAIEKNDPIREQMLPFMERLRDATGESVVLGKLLGEQVVYLGIVDGIHAIRYSAAVGDLKPVNTTSSGKALLSALPTSERLVLMSRARTAEGERLTTAQRGQLQADIERGLERGWFIGRGENVIDVMGIATLVEAGGDALSIGLAGPLHRMEPKLPVLGEQLHKVCREILWPR